MKIKGKEISKDYINKSAGLFTGLVTQQTLIDLEKDLEESLDSVAFEIQKTAFTYIKRTDDWQKKDCLERFIAGGILESLMKINWQYGTSYETGIDKVVEYFEVPKKPLKQNIKEK